MNQILAALLNAQPANTASASAQQQAPAADSSAPGSAAASAAQFKSQFDQAVQTLSNAVNANAQGATTTTQGAAQATTAGSTVQSAALADSLQASLQKKIADLLAKGESVSEIAQQLAASLASTLAQQFGGNTAEIQKQLQTAFAAAITLPTGTGPPPSSTDLASALAQRFRQVADVAAGVLGETGQSNRIFAGSNLDAATTAGVQPAPATTTPATTASSTSAQADSIATDAQALLASLTASQGDGKTVATNGAQTIGSNGDTLLGRILARAQAAQVPAATPAQPSATQTPAPLTLEQAPAQASVLTAMALAQASVALGTPAAPTTSAPDPSAAAVQRIVADTGSAASIATEAPLTANAPAPLNPAVVAFLKSFSDALTTTSTAVGGKTETPAGTETNTLLASTDTSSSNSPTIGAFAPVQGAIQNDAASDATQHSNSNPATSQSPADPSAVVEQLMRGVFMNTTGDTSTVRMRLVPETLGDISVKLTISGSNVSAQVMAQTPQAHDALVAGQAQLTRSLADAGLKLTSFSVDMSGGFASFQQQQQQQSSQNGSSNGRAGTLGGVDTTETDESAPAAASTIGPPVLTGANWNALNYLV